MDFPPEIVDIARRVAARGGRAYLVGGCVRDRRLDVAVTDWDIEVFGLEPAALEATLREGYRVLDVGRSYGVLKIEGVSVDVSLPRRETKVGRGHRGFEVDSDPWLSVREAAIRRDLTINAMYLDPLTGELEDPLGGQVDLEAGLLRHCSSRFPEDPLRVLRVMQFAARLDFDVHPETVEVCRRIDLGELPTERIAGEWRKLFVTGVTPSRGLQFLQACGAARFFPGLEAWSPEQWARVAASLDVLAGSSATDDETRVVLGMTLLAREFAPDRGAVEGLLEVLSLRLASRARAAALVEAEPLLDRWDVAGRPERLVRRLALEAPIDELIAAGRARSAPSEPLDALEEAARRLGVERYAPEAWVQGRDLLALGARPGPGLGEVLKACFEAQLDGEFESREAALDWSRRRLDAGT